MSWADFTRNDYSEPMPNGKTFFPIPPGFVQFEPAILKDVCDFEHDSDDGCVTRAPGSRDPIGSYMSGGVAAVDFEQNTQAVRQLQRNQDAAVKIVKLKVRWSNQRRTDTGRDTSGRVELNPSAKKHGFLPIRQTKSSSGEHISTEATLASAIYVGQEPTAIKALRHGMPPRTLIRLTTQRKNKVIAIQLHDRVSKKSMTLCHLPKKNVVLEIKLFEDKYCVDIIEGSGDQFVRRWCLFLATDTRARSRSAKNLWNHLCSTFSIMPDTMLRLMSPLTETAQPPYDFRNNTLKQRASRQEASGSGLWTVDLKGRQKIWSFTGLLGRNQIQLERLTSGLLEDSSQSEETSPAVSTDVNRHLVGRGRKIRGRNRGGRTTRSGGC